LISGGKAASNNLHNFYVGIGPSVALHLFSKALDSRSYSTSHKLSDVYANIAAGYKLTKKLDVNLRYSHGLINIVKDKNLYGSYNTRYH